MKGLKVIRAKPSNAIDVYPLLTEAAKAGLFEDKPSAKELKMYYFKSLIDEMSSPLHLWYLARRGRGYLGYLHAIALPSRWDGTIQSIVVDTIYVTEKYRKMGVGSKLIEELKNDADNLGIKKILFASPESQDEQWIKKFGAAKLKTLMGVNL